MLEVFNHSRRAQHSIERNVNNMCFAVQIIPCAIADAAYGSPFTAILSS